MNYERPNRTQKLWHSWPYKGLAQRTTSSISPEARQGRHRSILIQFASGQSERLPFPKAGGLAKTQSRLG